MKYFIPAILLFFGVEAANAQCATNPSISSFSPVSGEAGTTVTITGSGFDPVAGNNTIFFGNVKTTPFFSNGYCFAGDRSCGSNGTIPGGK